MLKRAYFCLMEDALHLPVTYKGTDLEFPVVVRKWGLSYRFEVDVDGTPVYFEPDEEGNLRAIIEEGPQRKMPPLELLKIIGETLQSIL